MEFSRQEYWSELPFSSLGELPNPGIKTCLLCLLHWQTGWIQVLPLGLGTKAQICVPPEPSSKQPMTNQVTYVIGPCKHLATPPFIL